MDNVSPPPQCDNCFLPYGKSEGISYMVKKRISVYALRLVKDYGKMKTKTGTSSGRTGI
jgi:hypothetical protein